VTAAAAAVAGATASAASPSEARAIPRRCVFFLQARSPTFWEAASAAEGAGARRRVARRAAKDAEAAVRLPRHAAGDALTAKVVADMVEERARSK